MIYIGYSDEELKEVKYQDTLNTKTERWERVKIDGFKTYYKVSNFGRILNTKTKKIKDFSKDNSRYYRFEIRFKDDNGETQMRRVSVHRLVAMYFCKIPKRHLEKGLGFEDLVPNHKDGVKHHNASFNLEWVTQKENSKHAWKEGLCDSFRGEKCHLAKMTEEDAIEICELIMEKKSTKEIQKITGRSKKQIQHIRNKECWKHITKKYDFPKLGKAVPNTLSNRDIENICKLIAQGDLSDPKIAAQFGCSREYVRDIRLKKRKKEISQYYF